MYRDNDPEDDFNESDDSNDENYYTNDYPDDGEGAYSEGEEDIRRAVEDFDIGNFLFYDFYFMHLKTFFKKYFLDGDRELSSDDEEENSDFVYSVDSEAFGFEDDIDYCNVNRYGSYGDRYSRYKRRFLQDSSNFHSNHYAEEPDADDYSD